MTIDKPLDRRQKKTRLAIQTALLSLMKSKPLDKITVSELAAAADVNRKTFYNHYSNVYEVRRELDQHYIDRFLHILSDTPPERLRSDPVYFIETLVDNLAADMERTRLIFDSGEHHYLAQRFREITMPTLRDVSISHTRYPQYLPYVTEYLTSGLVSLLELWVRSESPLPPAEFADMAANLICSSANIMGFDKT